MDDDDESDVGSGNRSRKIRRTDESSSHDKPMFVKSKWEEVDPDEQQGSLRIHS